jgi:hypothetical protein
MMDYFHPFSSMHVKGPWAPTEITAPKKKKKKTVSPTRI